MDIKVSGSDVVINGLTHFNLRQTLECGQAFRWTKNNACSYTGVVHNRVVTLSQTEGHELGTVELMLSPCTLEDVTAIWLDYLDLNTDYGAIQAVLSKDDPVLESAIAYGDGIRILNQDLWEMILTFILSANNNIPRITASLEALARTYGRELMERDGRMWYGLPEPSDLAFLDPTLLRALGLGYRDQYVVKTAGMISSGEVCLESLHTMDSISARKVLLTLPGVGPKVADCILLFGLSRRDAFPVDTWVKKVMSHFYCEKEATLKDISRFAEEKFGSLGGYAQQYLFYYARENRLGQ